MTRQELEARIRAAVEDYIESEECYGDNAELEIDLSKGIVKVRDAMGMEDNLLSNDVVDYYDIMDLVQMSPSEPGKWEVDEEAVKSVASDYFD